MISVKSKYLSIFLFFLFSLSLIGSVNAANENINPDNNLLYEMAEYYHQECSIEWVIVKLDSGKLKHGDYVQLRDFKDNALHYNCKDSEGYVYFSDDYGSYRSTQENFDKMYTGYALLINY